MRITADSMAVLYHHSTTATYIAYELVVVLARGQFGQFGQSGKFFRSGEEGQMRVKGWPDPLLVNLARSLLPSASAWSDVALAADRAKHSVR